MLRSSICGRLFAAVATLLCCLTVTTANAAGTLTVLPEPRPAPAFSLPGTDGNTQRLDDFRGRYLLVNFWAVWCAPCRREMPSMERLSQKLADQPFTMLAIHVGPDIDSARDAAKSLGVSFPIAVDEDLALTAWQVRGLPASYLLDPQGNIVASATGEREWDSATMVAALKELMTDVSN